ncbi:MAG: hypothetical protein H7210_00335, partial [Pyrinomonadaceae bacterium]|nr:hypothetical protein [Phycisphaerales bacterium]
MHGRMARGAISRKTAMILGMTCSLVAVGGILSFYFNAGSTGNSTPPSGAGPTGGATGGPPDVPIDVGPGGIGKTGRALNELIDQKNPTRVKAHISWKQLDPLPKGQYTIVEPRAWIYLEDGRTLELRAVTGTIRFTGDGKQKRPESGRFEGGVQVRVFGPGVKPAGVVAREVSEDVEASPALPAMLLAAAASMNFDTLTNDYSTTDRVMISTEQTEAELGGLHIVYNDLLGRPDLIETTSGFMRFTKAAKKADGAVAAHAGARGAGAGAPQTPAAGGLPSGATPAPVAGAKAAKIDLYRADFAQQVNLSTRGQSIASEQLLVWARLIDGKLADDALGSTAEPAPVKGATTPSSTGATSLPTAASSEVPSAAPGVAPSAGGTKVPNGADVRNGTGEPTPPMGPTLRDRLAALRGMPPESPASITPVRDDDILLEWAGPMSVYTLEAPPAELAKDEVAARFVGGGDQPVKLSDKPTADGIEGPHALCVTLDYGATTKNAVLSGNTSVLVELVDKKNKRSATVNRFEINLASGVGHIPGRGVLSATGDAPSITPVAVAPGAEADPANTGSPAEPTAPQRTLTWTDSADFQFDVGGQSPGDAGIRSLREASFTGAVAASDGRASITGEFLHAWFSATAHRDTTFSRVVVEGKAVGEAWSGDSREEFKRLAADRFDVGFIPAADGKDTEPYVLTATGNVKGEQHEYKKAPVTGGDAEGVRAPGAAAVQEPDPSPVVAPAPSPAPPEATPAASAQQSTMQTTTLTSDFLEALLVTKREGDKKRTDVSDAHARGKVHFSRSDGITADADELRAQLDDKSADLTGSKVVIARGGSSVSGTAMRLDGKDNSLLVRSSGEIDHDPPQKPGDASAAVKSKDIGHVHVAWTTSMSYNDTTGIGMCEGNAVVTQDQDVLHHSTVRAERVALYMEPAAN